MTTQLEQEIMNMETYGSMYMSANALRQMHKKKGELAKKQQDSLVARNAANTGGEKSAKTQAGQARVASQQQMAAAKKMQQMQQAQFTASTTRLDAATQASQSKLDPWYQAGTDALGKLQTKIDSGPGEFKESPGYKFRMEEGQKAIARSAAARGGVLSGAAVKEGMRYGQNFATNDYDNFLRRYYESMAPLERMSGQGMQAGTQQGSFGLQGAQQYAQLGQNATNQMAAAVQYGGEAQASGTMNAANIMAAQQTAARERNYGYAAWKGGSDF